MITSKTPLLLHSMTKHILCNLNYETEINETIIPADNINNLHRMWSY